MASQRQRRWLSAIARLMVAAVALGYVLSRVDLADHVQLADGRRAELIATAGDTLTVRADGETFSVDIGQATPRPSGALVEYGLISLVRQARWAPVLVAVVVFAPVPMLLSRRWQVLVRAQGINISFLEAMGLTFAGLFCNFFLIGTTGGDVVKAYWLSRHTDRRAGAFVSVFVDRLVGVVVLAGIALVLVLIFWNQPHVAKLARGVGILLVLTALAIGLYGSQRWRRLFRLSALLQRLPGGAILQRLDQAAMVYRHQYRAVAWAAGCSLVLQLVASLASYFLGRSLGLQAGIEYYFLYVPLAFLIGSIPITAFWGLGLLEGAYVLFFAGSDLTTANEAALLAMSVRLLQLGWSLPGVLVLLRGRWSAPDAQPAIGPPPEQGTQTVQPTPSNQAEYPHH